MQQTAKQDGHEPKEKPKKTNNLKKNNVIVWNLWKFLKSVFYIYSTGIDELKYKIVFSETSPHKIILLGNFSSKVTYVGFSQFYRKRRAF